MRNLRPYDLALAVACILVQAVLAIGVIFDCARDWWKRWRSPPPGLDR